MTMTDTPTLMWPPVEPLRDGYGRYAGALVDGTEIGWSTPKSRVTTIVGRTEEKSGIHKWEMGKAGIGLAADPQHYADLCEFVRNDDEKAVKAHMAQMAEVGGSQDGANIGKRYHELVGAAIAGAKLPDDVTLTERRDIKAVLALFKKHNAVVEDLERIVVNKELDYAGTLDYRLRLPEFDLPVIADLKTGNNIVLGYPSYRSQKAAYAHCAYEVSDDGHLVEAPPVDQNVGFIVHLVPGSAEATFIGSNLVEGWRLFRLAHRVWSQGRGRPRTLSYEETLVTQASIQIEREVLRSTWCQARIDVLRGIKDDPSEHGVRATKFLRSIWPEGIALPSETSAWYGDDLARVEAVVTVTETEYVAPYANPDPTGGA